MEVDFLALRIRSVKRLSAVLAARHSSDTKAKSEEQNPGDEEVDDLQLDVSKLQRALEELQAQISNNRLNLSGSNSNLSTKSSAPYALGKKQDSKTKPKANAFDFSSEDEHGDVCNDEKSVFESSSDKADSNLAMDDSDGDDDKKACFPCPFCYIDIDIHDLCNHLEDEHCFNLKNAVCPICAASLGKDVMAHFVLQHTSSLKHKKRSQKSGPWIASSSMLGKELCSFLGSSTNGRANMLESASDLLISPILNSVSPSDHDGSPQDESSNKSATGSSPLESTRISSLDGGNALDYEERTQRAAFVQQLIASTIF